MPRGGVSVGRPGPTTVTYIHRLKMDETGKAGEKVKLTEVNQLLTQIVSFSFSSPRQRTPCTLIAQAFPQFCT